MNISARCEYACRAVVELAKNAAAGTERRNIPEKYLVHILLHLKRAGIVRSVRGAQGGYLLAQSPEDISLLDITSAVDGPILDPLPVSGTETGDVQIAWRAAADGISEVLGSLSIKSILDQSAKPGMYYI